MNNSESITPASPSSNIPSSSRPNALPCSQGCGFFGTKEQEGMCSKCYKQHRPKQQQEQNESQTLPIPQLEKSDYANSQLAAPTAALTLSESRFTSASTLAIPSNLSSPSDVSVAAIVQLKDVDDRREQPLTLTEVKPSAASTEESATQPIKKGKNRCAVCNKKTGLDFFTCQCESGIFCATHRLPFTHNCTFDAKQKQAEILRKANPVVKDLSFEKI